VIVIEIDFVSEIEFEIGLGGENHWYSIELNVDAIYLIEMNEHFHDCNYEIMSEDVASLDNIELDMVVDDVKDAAHEEDNVLHSSDRELKHFPRSHYFLLSEAFHDPPKSVRLMTGTLSLQDSVGLVGVDLLGCL